jgi:hypothetical protein
VLPVAVTVLLLQASQLQVELARLTAVLVAVADRVVQEPEEMEVLALLLSNTQTLKPLLSAQV